jgi:hypothetical protein
VKRIFTGRRAALIAATALVPLAITAASAQAATAGPAQASPAASVTPDVSCTGQVAYSKSISSATASATEHGFYYTASNPSEVCVGQADLTETFTDAGGLDERVRVHNGGANGPQLIPQILNDSGSGENSGTLKFTTQVNTLFNVSQVTVCVALVTQADPDGPAVDGVSICKTLG